jgi:hypothetical protein
MEDDGLGVGHMTAPSADTTHRSAFLGCTDLSSREGFSVPALGPVAEADRVSGKQDANDKPSEMVRRDLLKNEMAYLDRFRSGVYHFIIHDVIDKWQSRRAKKKKDNDGNPLGSQYGPERRYTAPGVATRGGSTAVGKSGLGGWVLQAIP